MPVRVMSMRSPVHLDAGPPAFCYPPVGGFPMAVRQRRPRRGGLSQVMPYQDADLEKLYTFGRFLEAKLPQDPKKGALGLEGDVALRYYRLQKTGEGSIQLDAREPIGLKGPTDVGTKKGPDQEARLSEIIEILNDSVSCTR
jgi:hypothetical protein